MLPSFPAKSPIWERWNSLAHAPLAALVLAVGLCCCGAYRREATQTSPSRPQPGAAAWAFNGAHANLAEASRTRVAEVPVLAFTIRECGDPRLIGGYAEVGEKRGRPMYRKWTGGTAYDDIILEWSGTRGAWKFHVGTHFFGRRTLYLSTFKTATFPEAGWYSWHGEAPPPTLHRLGGRSTSPRILIAHASVGKGHTFAAKAIQQQLQADMPYAEVVLFDIIEEQTIRFENGVVETVTPPSHLRYLCRELFLRMRSATPSLMSGMLDLLDARADDPLTLGYRYSVHSTLLYNMRHFERFVLRYRWDLIVNTHPFAAMTLGSLRIDSYLDIPSVTVITAYYPHRLWISNTDQYFVATEQVQDALFDEYSVAPVIVTVSGIPISPRIRDITREQARVAAAGAGVALPPRHGGGRLVLAMAIADSTADCVSVWLQLLSFAREHGEHRVTAVTGQKTELKEAFLGAVAGALPTNFRLLGFTHKLPELMAVSDIIVSKPTALKTSEALALGLPFLLVRSGVGHAEKPAADFLLSRGAAIEVSGPEEIPDKLRAAFSVAGAASEAPIDVLRRAAEYNGYPSAAAEIAGYAQELITVESLREVAPGICCCGTPAWSSIPYTGKQKACRVFHAPQTRDEPLVERSQYDCSFSWGFRHTATCPLVCGGFTQYERSRASADDCSRLTRVV